MSTRKPPGTIYLLHFSRPYEHARHYTGNPESSRFLKAGLAADGWEFAGLPGVLRARRAAGAAGGGR